MNQNLNPFNDDELRRSWLECLMYADDSDLEHLTYMGWLEAEIEICFDWFKEELAEGDFGVINAYVERVEQIRAELSYLRRRAQS